MKIVMSNQLVKYASVLGTIDNQHWGFPGGGFFIPRGVSFSNKSALTLNNVGHVVASSRGNNVK
jgi:hypothetical protein